MVSLGGPRPSPASALVIARAISSIEPVQLHLELLASQLLRRSWTQKPTYLYLNAPMVVCQGHLVPHFQPGSIACCSDTQIVTKIRILIGIFSIMYMISLWAKPALTSFILQDSVDISAKLNCQLNCHHLKV